MGMLVGQLIKILEQFDQDREVMIHTLSGETVEVRGYLDKEGKVERRRKRRAYGSQGWKGWGGEIYFKKYGEIMMDVVDKKKARREAKKHIENELQDQL